ncbi:hypothetical protein AAEH94_24430, partial [Shewanella algae]
RDRTGVHGRGRRGCASVRGVVDGCARGRVADRDTLCGTVRARRWSERRGRHCRLRQGVRRAPCRARRIAARRSDRLYRRCGT